MDNKLIETIEQIAELATSALAYAKRERSRMGTLLRLVEKQKDTTSKMKKKNIREFKPGLYQGRAVVNGKRVTVYGRTAVECEKKLTAKITVFESAPICTEVLTDTVYTLGNWLAEWVKVYKAPKLRPCSLNQINICIRLHIPAKLKAQPLSALKPLDIQKALNDIQSSRMRKYTYDVYSESLHRAFLLEYLPRPIMEFVEPITHDREPGKSLTHLEQEKYLTAISGHALEKLFKFYLLTGCRRSEALRITWADIDIEKQTLHIPGTKNKYSDRIEPFLPGLLDLLAIVPHSGARLFTYRADYVTAQQKAVFPTHTVKDLRHTFATRCFESGIPVEVYKLWLGHSKKSTVAESTYTHLNEIQKQQAIKFTLTPDTE